MKGVLNVVFRCSEFVMQKSPENSVECVLVLEVATERSRRSRNRFALF